MTRRGLWLLAVMSVVWGIPYLLIKVAVRHLDPGLWWRVDGGYIHLDGTNKCSYPRGMEDDTRTALRDLAEALQDLARALTAASVPVRPHVGVSSAKAVGKAQRVLDRLGPF